MKVSVEELSSTRRKLAVELDSEFVESQEDRSYRELARSVQLKGFRPGRAPRPILKQLYGKEIEDEITGKLIEESIVKVLEEQKLEPVATPIIEDKQLAEDHSFRYTALVEISPSLDVQNYKGVEVAAEAIEVKDAEVEETLEQLRASRGKVVDREGDAAARPGDLLVADWDMEVEGETGSQASRQDATLELGEKGLLPELVEGLVGAKAGETRSVEALLGDRAADPKLVGKKATFRVTVKKVQERVLPALDDAFAVEAAALESLDLLRTDLRDKIRARRERDARSRQADAIVGKLLDAHPFEAPESLVEQAVRSLTRMSGGEVPEGESDEAREERSKAIHAAAERQVRADLLLKRVADQEGLSVTDEQLDAALDERAQAIGQEGKVLRAAYERKGVLDDFRGDLRRQRVLDFLLENAKILGT